MSSTGASTPDYLDSDPQPSGGGKRWALLGSVAVGVVALTGAGVWGVTSLFDSGDSPAQALPSDTIGFVAVDLDPGKGQQLEAYQTMKKFPALAEELDLRGPDDLKSDLMRSFIEDIDCPGVTYERDFAPWLGNSASLAGRPGSSATETVPFAVVEAGDESEAKAAIDRLADCDADSDPAGDAVGFGYAGGYVYLAETQAQVDETMAAVSAGLLSDEPEYADRMGEAGGEGFVTGYLSSQGLNAMLDELTDNGSMLGLTESESMSDYADAMKDFEGAAMSLRFADGGLDLSMVAAGLAQGDDFAGNAFAQDLPASTAAALSVAMSPTFVADFLDNVPGVLGGEGLELESQMEANLGVTPDELQAILGQGVTLSLDSEVPQGAWDASSPDSIPAGLRISGDPATIRPPLDKMLAFAWGADAQEVIVVDGEDNVTLGLMPSYVEKLSAGGDLGAAEAFTAALPDAEDSAVQAYVDFNVGSWLERTFDSSWDEETAANLEPLKSMGITATNSQDLFEMQLLLTTD